MSNATGQPSIARDEATVGAELERYIRAHFAVPSDDDLFTRAVNLWEEGYVDSTGVVEVLAYIEQTWQIIIPDEVLFDPEFTSIAGMAKLIAGLNVEAA